jgi:hypothetical protein
LRGRQQSAVARAKTEQSAANRQTKKTMIAILLGKILFPRQQPWQQERDARVILGATVVALVFAGLVALVIFWRNGVIR